MDREADNGELPLVLLRIHHSRSGDVILARVKATERSARAMAAQGLAVRGVVAVWWSTSAMIIDDVLTHYRALWGEPSRKAIFTAFGHRVEVFKWSEDVNPEGVNIYATIGCSAHSIVGFDPAHRVEFYTGLLPAADDVAKPLAMVALDPMLNNTPLTEGHTITYSEPLWHGTSMNNVLILRPIETIIPSLQKADLHVEFLQVVPVFASELAFIRRGGYRSMLAHWARNRVPLWDPRRSPDPPLA